MMLSRLLTFVHLAPDQHAVIRRRGSILIYVLWIAALLGVFTLSIGYGVRQKLKMIERVEARRAMRLAAESAVQRGVWAIHQRGDSEKQADALNSAWSHQDSLFNQIPLGTTVLSLVKTSPRLEEEPQYGLTDEESKINLNLLRNSDVLTRLLVKTAGLSGSDAQIVSDSLLDWVDDDDHVNASGAENEYYRSQKKPLLPKNKPLDAVEELLYIRGMTPEILNAIRPFVTLFGDGKINLNTASDVVLSAEGLDDEIIRAILAFRMGVDQLAGTADDGVFYAPEELLTHMSNYGGITEDSQSALESFLARGGIKVTSDYFSAIAEVSRKSGREILEAQVIISRDYGIQAWYEMNTQRA